VERVDTNGVKYNEIISYQFTAVWRTYLDIGTHDIAVDFEQEFNACYNLEHASALASVPGCPRVRRFLAINSQPKYMAINDLEHLDVIKSEAWATARDTDWTAKIRLYRQNHTRQLYQLIFPTS
jgi:hypothetical protein